MNRKNKIKEQNRRRRQMLILGIAGGVVLLGVLLVVMFTIISEIVRENDRPPIPQIDTEEVVCKQFSSFSGQYVEDGSDVLVENVASMLVTNKSDQFLDLATLEYEIDGKKATFVVTGLPAGKSTWVMEQSKMTVTNQSEFEYIDRITSFKDGVTATTDKISISSEGNMLTAVNNTEERLESVFVYYKTLHTDGNFFGGITYLVKFGDLEPGEKVTKLAGHYEKGKTEIVRIGWKDGETLE